MKFILIVKYEDRLCSKIVSDYREHRATHELSYLH